MQGPLLNGGNLREPVAAIYLPTLNDWKHLVGTMFERCDHNNFMNALFQSGAWYRFWLYGKDGKIEVRQNEDHEVVMVASLEHGAYQVFPIVQHGKIYITATDFWHQATFYSEDECRVA